MIYDIAVGKRYKLTGLTSWDGADPNNHGVQMRLGGIYECVGLQSLRPGPHLNPTNTIYLRDDAGRQISVYLQDLSPGWSTRKEHADYLEGELKSIKDEHKKLDKKASELNHQITRLREFESDEQEVAAMMIRAVRESVDVSEEEAIKNLAKTLKGRLRTDLL